jgi:menaquinone-dependent protoporphyrinogen oxidase
MSRILVLYGTTDGQTQKIANALGETLRADGCHVDVMNAGRTPEVSPRGFDAIIVAASLHAGGYQRSIKRWTRVNSVELNRKPTAFVSVCLGVLEKNPATHRDLNRIMSQFLDASGWRPGFKKMVAGALPYTKYNFIKRWLMHWIVASGHAGDTDTSRDYEYTDWADLKAFAHQFAAQCGKVLNQTPVVGRRPVEAYLI